MMANRDAVMIQDTIYADLVYTQNMVMFSKIPEIAHRVNTNDGFSKGPRATGLRSGWIIVPQGQEALREALIGIANAIYGCTSPFINYCLIPTAQERGDQDIESHRLEFLAKRDAVIPAIAALPRTRVNNPEGGFYALLDVEETGIPAEEFFHWALKQGVGLLPNRAFGFSVQDKDGKPLLREENRQ